jgi:hypothetical protein
MDKVERPVPRGHLPQRWPTRFRPPAFFA